MNFDNFKYWLPYWLPRYRFTSVSGWSRCQKASREVTMGNKCTVFCKERCEWRLSSMHPYKVLGEDLFIYQFVYLLLTWVLCYLILVCVNKYSIHLILVCVNKYSVHLVPLLMLTKILVLSSGAFVPLQNRSPQWWARLSVTAAFCYWPVKVCCVHCCKNSAK